MAEDIRISELSNVSSLGNNDLIEVSQVNAQSETGYDSKKATLINVGDRVCNGIEYANALYTSNKKIIGAINELTTYIPVWNNTASGAIATFDTSLALPLQDLQIAINAVQESGTPTPSSPKLISGFTGANIKVAGSNLWDEEWEAGGLNNNTGEPTTSNRIRSKNFMPITPNTQIRCVENGVPNTEDINVFFYDENKTFISHANWQTTPTTPANCFYFKLHTAFNYGTTYNNDISINYPATDTAYHAYNANSTTTSISWQDEAGTVYGGSLDVTSGVLTVTHGFIDLGSISWAYQDASGGVNRFRSATVNGLKIAPVRTLKILCDHLYNAVSPDGAYIDNSIYNYNNEARFFVTTSSTSDANTLKTNMSGWLAVFELTTPATYQLTPNSTISAIVGTNNIFADTNGDTSVVYACSLKDYIDRQ